MWNSCSDKHLLVVGNSPGASVLLPVSLLVFIREEGISVTLLTLWFTFVGPPQPLWKSNNEYHSAYVNYHLFTSGFKNATPDKEWCDFFSESSTCLCFHIHFIHFVSPFTCRTGWSQSQSCLYNRAMPVIITWPAGWSHQWVTWSIDRCRAESLLFTSLAGSLSTV